MKKILILKNDRVGDLFNSLEAINLIIKNNSDASIEIILSEISKNLNFLFNLNHVKVSYLPYHLTFYDKLKLKHEQPSENILQKYLEIIW